MGLQLLGKKTVKKVCLIFLSVILVLSTLPAIAAADQDYIEADEVTVHTINREENTDYTVLKDIAYGDDSRQKMDIYVPVELNPIDPNGAFILLHGGWWINGDKEDEAVVKHAAKLASRGYLSVVINMRHAAKDPDTGEAWITGYDMVNDVQESIRRLQAMSVEYGWNVTQVAVAYRPADMLLRSIRIPAIRICLILKLSIRRKYCRLDSLSIYPDLSLCMMNTGLGIRIGQVIPINPVTGPR